MKNLIKKLRKFADERDWEQFHSPKNLSMALVVEAGEILECFQWLTEEQSRKLDSETLKRVKEEIGDVQIYLKKQKVKLRNTILHPVFRNIRPSLWQPSGVPVGQPEVEEGVRLGR